MALVNYHKTSNCVGPYASTISQGGMERGVAALDHLGGKGIGRKIFLPTVLGSADL